MGTKGCNFLIKEFEDVGITLNPTIAPLSILVLITALCFDTWL